MRVALPVFSPIRDLAGMVLLATTLCHEGATCFLVPDSRRWNELSTLAPDLVLINQLRRVRQALAADFTAAGVQIGVLDNEGGVMPDFSWYGEMLEPDASVRHSIALFCSWGEKLAQHAAQENWYRREQIEVTGMPRFDFYSPPWDEIALPASPPQNAWKRPLVLINGSFPIANPSSSTRAQKMKNIAKIRGGDTSYITTFQESQQRSLEGMVKLTNHLARRFPEVTFVYRPHPFERVETYHKLLEKRDNLHLKKEGGIQGWLRIADVLVQRGCTTAIEAGLLGLPALSPQWIETPDEIAAVEAVSVSCASQEELDTKLQRALNKENIVSDEIRAAHSQVIGDWFGGADGKSHERVARAILKHYDPKVSPDLEKCRTIAQQHPLDKLSLRARALRALNKKSLRATDKRADWENSEHFFDIETVRHLVEKIEECRPNATKKRLRVLAASQRGDYQITNPNGLTLTLFCE